MSNVRRGENGGSGVKKGWKSENPSFQKTLRLVVFEALVGEQFFLSLIDFTD